MITTNSLSRSFRAAYGEQVRAVRDLFAGHLATPNIALAFLAAIATLIRAFFLGLRALRTSTR